MISLRRRIGAQGTSAASRRSSHSAVVCCMMYSAILLMRAVAFTERAAGVAKRGSLASSGSPDARRKPCHSESEIVPAVMYPSLVLNTRSGRSLGSAAAASAPTTIYCIMPSGHRYEIMTAFVMSDPAWPMSRWAQAFPTRPSHALGPARSRRFPDGTGRLSPKSRNLQDQRLPFFLNRGPGARNYRVRAPDQEEQHDGSNRAKVPSARHATVRPLIEPSDDHYAPPLRSGQSPNNTA